MRIGVANMTPGVLSDIKADHLEHIVELGFTGASIHMTQPPETVTDADINHIRTLWDRAALDLVQFWGQYPSLITPDDKVRQEAIKQAQAIIKVGSKLGAACVGMRPTSFNPRGNWWAHPDNYLEATEDRLVDSLTICAERCAELEIPMTLECHVTTTLESPQRVRRIIERTGSDWVKMNLDPVNFIGTLRSAFDSGHVIRELFDELSPFIFIAHIKDVVVDDGFVVHISEGTPGDGILDYDTFFTLYERLLPHGYALIEHLPAEEVPRAKQFVDAKLQSLGIAR